MIRDDELSRLVKYAEALGVRVIFSNDKSYSAAEWTIDGSQITIFTKNNHSKTDTIIALVHELGHHCWFVHEKQRIPDLKFEEALLVEESNLSTVTPKHLRKKILDCELHSMEYWGGIWKDMDIKIPKWKMYEAMEYDSWFYKEYYKSGISPGPKRKKKKLKALRKKHKGVKYE